MAEDPKHLTHLTSTGAVHMVNVGQKAETARQARASAAVVMASETLELVRKSAGKKGDVLAVARVAAITAVKKASELIPLCHPVRVSGVDVDLSLSESLPGVDVSVSVSAFDRTGVEMEAMVAASAAALTIYDMVKGVQRGVEIRHLQLEEKLGGRSGHWRRGKTT
jgi:cyclic pyranopterin phosphate synthase